MSLSFLVTSKATPPPPQTNMLALSGSSLLAMHCTHLQGLRSIYAAALTVNQKIDALQMRALAGEA